MKSENWYSHILTHIPISKSKCHKLDPCLRPDKTRQLIDQRSSEGVSLLQMLLQKEKRRLVGRSPAYLLHGADCTVPTDVRVICEGLVQSVETLTHLVPDQPLLVRSHTRPAVDSKRDY